MAAANAAWQGYQTVQSVRDLAGGRKNIGEIGINMWGGGYFCTGMTGGKKRRKTLSGADLSEAGARKNLHQLLL